MRAEEHGVVSDEAKPAGDRTVDEAGPVGREPIFPPWVDHLVKLLGMGAAFSGVYVVGLVTFGLSPWAIHVGYMPEQPVPYSHALHAGELGIDCRYCHNSVEETGYAAVPPTQTCMNCHGKVWPASPKLAPVRESYAEGTPVEWIKIHDLPDYAYFNHSVHVNQGVSCVSCHGRVDRMEEVWQEKPLSMGWCIECHRDPAENLRPVDRSEVELLVGEGLVTLPGAVAGGIDPVSRFLDEARVTNLGWGQDIATEDRERMGRLLMEKRGLLDTEKNPTVRFAMLTNCSTCHR